MEGLNQLVMAIILITLSFSIADQEKTQKPYVITEFQHNPGLYFEKIDQIRFIKNSWKLVISVNLRTMTTHVPAAYTLMDKEFQRCQGFLDVSRCSEELRYGTVTGLLTELKQTQKHLERTLKEKSSNNNRRRNRAPLLGFVGTIARNIFGTMDYNDHEHFTKEIDKLYNDQRQFAHLLGNSTHIVKAEVDNLRQIAEKNTINLKTITSQLEISYNATQKLAKQASMLEYMNYLGRLGMEGEHFVSKYLEYCHKIIQAIQDSKHNIVNPILLKEEQLWNVIEEIEKHASDAVFPITRPKLDVSILSKISTITTGVNQGRFLISIEIPLLSRDTLDLYHLIPCLVPQTVQGNRSINAFIEPTFKHMAVSKTTKNYLWATEEFLEKCIPLETCLACPRGTPLRKASQKLPCEYQLLTNRDYQPDGDILRSCNIKLNNQKEILWNELEASEGWLYSAPYPENVEIICNGQSTEIITIHGTGTLYLHSNCSAETSNVILEGKAAETIGFSTIHTAAITMNISDFAPALMEIPKVPNVLTNIIPNILPAPSETKEFEISMQDTINKAEEIGLHHQEQYQHRLFSAATFGITGFLTIIMGILGYTLYARGINPCKIILCCVKRRASEPESRRRISFKPSIERIYEPPTKTPNMSSPSQIQTVNMSSLPPTRTVSMPSLPPPPPPLPNTNMEMRQPTPKNLATIAEVPVSTEKKVHTLPRAQSGVRINLY